VLRWGLPYLHGDVARDTEAFNSSQRTSMDIWAGGEGCGVESSVRKDFAGVKNFDY
jgi:hypothetical protein